MPYTSLEQLIDRFGEGMLVSLTDRGDVATDTIDTDVIDRVLADTDAQIDGYLGARYKLPLTATPAIVADLAQVIAVWKLHRFDPPQKVKDDYDDARNTLKFISMGTIVLDLDGVTPEGSGASGVQITDRERPFTAKNMKGFI